MDTRLWPDGAIKEEKAGNPAVIFLNPILRNMKKKFAVGQLENGRAATVIGRRANNIRNRIMLNYY